jgi:transposase
MDVSKRDAKVCVRVAGRGRRQTVERVGTWGSTTNAVLALREHLINEQVTLVMMEATGDYWKPFYYLLEDADFEVMLVNARHVKNLPGRKSDVSDAAWLAQLRAHGLVRGSFVPPAPIRQLRDLTRARTAMTRERGREIQRLEKLLEDAGIKLSSVASGHQLRVGPVDAARVDRWPTRPGRAGRFGQETPARQDPGVDRGANPKMDLIRRVAGLSGCDC